MIENFSIILVMILVVLPVFGLMMLSPSITEFFIGLILIFIIIGGALITPIKDHLSKKNGKNRFSLMTATAIKDEMVHDGDDIFAFMNKRRLIYTCPNSEMMIDQISQSDYTKLKEACAQARVALKEAQAVPAKPKKSIIFLMDRTDYVTVKEGGKDICEVNKKSKQIYPAKFQPLKDFVENAPACKAAALDL